MRFAPLFRSTGSALVLLAATVFSAEKAESVFRAGAATVDVTPQTFPRIIAGSFLEGRAEKANDALHVRCLVLDDGKTKIAFAIVDTCMMPQSLIDEAKGRASKECGIPVDHMMVSATHTHSAPAAIGCLGTRLDKEYATFLTGKIAEGIVAANKRLEPARIGWASVDDWEHTHNRRWIRKPEAAIVDPFGDKTGLANMHPGYLSKDVIGPSGPVDPGLSLIAVQAKDGRPLAVLANYSQHYFGASPVSSDYYGMFCKSLAGLMKQEGDGNGSFVCAMSQGTSGDLMWMDYGSAQKTITRDQYAEAVAKKTMEALQKVEYHDGALLGMVEKTLTLKYRVPDETRLTWAQRIAKQIENDLPKDKPQVYAREAVILNERQQTTVRLQAIRIGDLTISTLPNEVYALTGLKLKAQSPGAMHFNIELANGAEGYIPPPEQHVLGGYTTWPARTAGLEVQAEPKMVETLLGALEEATGKRRREAQDEHGPYAQAILDAKPVAYWRLNEAAGRTAKNSIAGGARASLTDGFAWYLPGVGSGTGTGAGEVLVPSAFSGPHQINRAVHLAGAELQTSLELDKTDYTIAVWFWLGEASGASVRSGTLIAAPGSEVLRCEQDAQHRARLAWGITKSSVDLRADDWHLAVLIRDGDNLRVHVDGREKPDLEAKALPQAHKAPRLYFGRKLQGKLDEIAVFERALSGGEIASFWNASGVAEQRAKADAEREQIKKQTLERAKAPDFAKGYDEAIDALKPSCGLRFEDGSGPNYSGFKKSLQLNILRNPATSPPEKWSVSLWFRNDAPNNSHPVTAYLFSRGPKGNSKAPGDHLGIGGTFREAYTGRLIVFNGNDANQVLSGSTVVPPGTWNHVVLVRDGPRVRLWLNGESKPEIDADLPVTAPDVWRLFMGARCDDFAPLNGAIPRAMVFPRALTADEARQLHAASGQPVGTPKAAATAPTKQLELASPPLPPEEAIKKWHVREGYRIELAAAEPVVLDPVAFDWDAQGRLWVVEMADYPLGMDGNGKAGGRVVMLEDTNDDARYDKRTVIAEGLNFPTGILTWRDGALVTAAPDVLYLGPTGEKKVLLTGFSTGNQQLRVNGLRWGMDGWVYCAAGAHHGGYNKGTEITSVLTSEKIALGSRDFRFKPDTGEFDPQSGPSQFGRAKDDWGHWFGVQNSFPLWHYVLQDHYLRRNPHVIPPDPVHQLFPRNPPVYPASSLEKRFHSFGESGRFTSACGIEVYRDRVLFDDGKTHAFTCEPFHNVVQHHVLEDDGVSFKATRDPAEKLDFLASEDRWCRPVMVRTGPDGALWVADMYRYMIEHPQWLPQNGKDELLPHYREGDDKGRIWRVSKEDTSVRPAKNALAKADKSVSITLNSQNGWVRDKAQMSALWNGLNEKAVAESVDAMTDSKVPQVRAQAAWTLHLGGKLVPSFLKGCLLDESDEVVVQAIQMAETQDWKDVEEALLLLVNGNRFNHPRIRMQLALSAGAWKGNWPADIVGTILDESPPGSSLAGAALSSALPHLITLSTQFAGTADERHDAIIGTLFRCAINSGNEGAITALVSQIKSPSRLNEVLAVLDEKGLSLAEFATQVKAPAAQAGVKHALDLLAQAAQVVRKAGEKPPMMELRLLSNDRAHRAEVADTLGGLWKRSTPDAAPSLLPLITRLQPAEAPDFLLSGWNERTPSLRSQIIETLLSNDTWTLTLLKRIESKQVEANACDAATRARLLKHPKAEVKKLASTVFADSSSAARVAVLEKFRPAITLTGDAAKGKAVFAQVCISCHKLDGVGLELGPDLRSVAQHDADKLMNSILDPSAVIEPGFMAYHCTLKNGEQLYGVIATETSTSLTLKMPGNVTRSLLRSDVATLKSTNTSLMPDGLEAALTPQSLADLIAYLKQAR